MAGKEKKSHAGGLIAILIIAALVAGVVALSHFGIIPNPFDDETGTVKTITESELLDVLRESNLYTAEYPCNRYTKVSDDNGNIKYYVAYEGTVKAGFDVNDIEVNLDEDDHTITIQLPEVTVQSVKVDVGSLDYIFEKEKYDTETVASEAYGKAVEDLTNNAPQDEIIKVATENAKIIEKELIEPWVNQVSDQKYEVKVLAYGEEK